MTPRLLAGLLLAVAGCAPAGEETSSPATTTTSTSSGTTSTSTATEKPPLVASFVAEDEAGDAPALLRMFNDTPDQILSMTLDDGREYAFYLIDPLAASDHVITMSDDMLEDAVLSIHTFDSCVRKPFASMTGPMVLEPGHAYAIHVTVEDGFAGVIEEEAMPEPFFGVRAHVFDPAASTTPAPAQLVLSMAGDPAGEVLYDTIFSELPEPYTYVPGAKLELEKIRFVDRAGVPHEASSPVVLEGAYGYTVHIDDAALEGAAITVPLDDLRE